VPPKYKCVELLLQQPSYFYPVKSGSILWSSVFYDPQNTLSFMYFSSPVNLFVCFTGWQCSFSTNTLKIPAVRSSQSVLQLLHGFFIYYHNFDFSENVVCPLIGLPVHKNFFSHNPKDLPQAMDIYVCQVTKNKHAERFRTKCCMCVQDPFDQSHNLTKATTPAILQKFKILCRLTGDLCANIGS
jgi:hypothetical protein